MTFVVMLVCLLLTLLLFGIAQKKALFRYHLATMLLAFVIGVALTGASSFYKESQFSGTYFQEYHGYPRSYYIIRLAEAFGDPIATSEKTFFNIRFFIENIIVYTSLLYFIFFIIKWIKV